MIAVAAAACGTSSSNGPHAPPAPTAAQLARLYDSLATALDSAGTQSDSFRAEIVAVLNGVNADGVAPTTVSLTVASDTATWFANVADLVDSGAADSLQIYTLWSSTSVAEANITVFSFGTVSSSQSIAAGGDLLGAASASLTESTAEVGGSCTFTPVMHVYAPYPTYDPGLPCALDDAVLSGTIVDRPDTTATSRIASIVIPATTIHGVRLQFPHYAFLRVRSLLTRAGTPPAAREGGVTRR